ncbi:MAG: DUF4145 domain-containing protein [Cyanobacteria bacterium M_surface_10_m2_119]|nr:DUF4145 domain-containing protein [Cyanobacteria bacterium M_surface_10_m2_119]
MELRVGDLPLLGLEADLLVVSAFEGHYVPLRGTLLGRLHEAYGLDLSRLAMALDLRDSPLRCWVSEPLQLPSGPPEQSRFRQLAVIEGGMVAEPGDLLPWPPFNRLFSLLALLPMRGITCGTVASPLLGSGQQGIDPLAHYPDLLEAYRDAFRHVPELRRLILFDRTDQHLRPLAQAIDVSLGRSAAAPFRLDLQAALSLKDGLVGLLRRRNRSDTLSHDISELNALLRAEQVSPVALGIHARRVVEQLVLQQLATEPDVERLTLDKGIRRLRDRGADRWLISCLHQVRSFGNWMGHPPGNGQARAVQLHDVLAMLAALQRVVEDYPWLSP